MGVHVTEVSSIDLVRVIQSDTHGRVNPTEVEGRAEVEGRTVF